MGKLAGPGESLTSDASEIIARVNQDHPEFTAAVDEMVSDADAAVAQAQNVQQAASVTILVASAVTKLLEVGTKAIPVLAGMATASGVLTAAQATAAKDCWLKNMLSGKPLFDGMPTDITAAINSLFP